MYLHVFNYKGKIMWMVASAIFEYIMYEKVNSEKTNKKKSWGNLYYIYKYSTYVPPTKYFYM